MVLGEVVPPPALLVLKMVVERVGAQFSKLTKNMWISRTEPDDGTLRLQNEAHNLLMGEAQVHLGDVVKEFFCPILVD
jgi:hypothetical protein